MAKPTPQDAQVLLQLATWYTESQVSEAINWARSDAFTTDYAAFTAKFPSGSDGRLLLNRILGFYETVGTLWKNQLLNEDLLFDWLWVPGIWDLVKNHAAGMRAEFENAGLWENFDMLAERQQTIAGKTDRNKTANAAKATKKAATTRKASTSRRR